MLVFFRILKYNFKKVVRKEIFNGATEISKVDFFSFFQRFHNQTFKNPKIYQSAFRKTGLIPFNPLVVLERDERISSYIQIPEPVIETPSSPLLSSSSRICNSTPYAYKLEPLCNTFNDEITKTRTRIRPFTNCFSNRR